MFQATHSVGDVRVQQRGKFFVKEDGKKLPVNLYSQVQAIASPALESALVSLKPSHLCLVLRAADQYPPQGCMPGYAADQWGNCATLIRHGVVRLQLTEKDGGGKYEIVIPESISISVTVLEG